MEALAGNIAIGMCCEILLTAVLSLGLVSHRMTIPAEMRCAKQIKYKISSSSLQNAKILSGLGEVVANL